MKRALLSCVAVAVMFTGCADDDDDGDGVSPMASVRAGVPAVDAAITVPRGSSVSVPASETPPADPTMTIESIDTTTAPAYVDVDVGPGLGTDEYVGARDDVELERCELDGDHWVAAGTVTNSSGAGAAYRIYVAFNPPDSAAARGLVQTDFLVPEGESQRWEVVAWIPDPALECVLRVERISG